MDDKRFDDFIKNRLDERPLESFDPAALADLNLRMAADMVTPWYVTYRYALLTAAAVVVILLFNGGLFYYMWQNEPDWIRNSEPFSDSAISGTAMVDTIYIANNNYKNELLALKKQIADLNKTNDQSVDALNRANLMAQLYQSQSKQLTAELGRLQRTFASITSDTVMVSNTNEMQLVALQRELEVLNSKIDSLNTVGSMDKVPSPLKEEGLVKLGKVEELPQDLLDKLEDYDLLITMGNDAYLKPNDKFMPLLYKQRGTKSGEEVLVLVPLSNTNEEMVAQLRDVEEKSKGKSGLLPVRMHRELEKHYTKGVGIMAGPTIGVYKPFFDVGKGETRPVYGMKADFIMSPSISIETGFNYIQIKSEIEGQPDLSRVAKPQFDPSRGELITMEVESEFIEVPLNVKYKYPIGEGAIFGSLGVSSVFYSSQVYDYEQSFETGNQTLNVGSGANFIPSPQYVNYANISLGITKLVKKQNSFELSITYQKSLNDMGESDFKNSLLGLRTAYWFKLR